MLAWSHTINSIEMNHRYISTSLKSVQKRNWLKTKDKKKTPFTYIWKDECCPLENIMTFWKNSHSKTKGILGKRILKMGFSLEILWKKGFWGENIKKEQLGIQAYYLLIYIYIYIFENPDSNFIIVGGFLYTTCWK